MKRLIAVAAIAAFGQGAFATSTLINFDNVADATVINLAYQGLGVTFNNPLGVSPDNPSSPNIFARSSAVNATPQNVVSVFASGVPAFDARWGAVEAVFTDLQQKVSIDAAIVRLPEGLGTPTNDPKMEVYDASNTLLAVVHWNFGMIPQPPVGGITAFEPLRYTSGSNNIAKVRFMSGQPFNAPSNFGVFDNLYFTTVVPEPASSAMLLLGLGVTGLAAWGRKRKG